MLHSIHGLSPSVDWKINAYKDIEDSIITGGYHGHMYLASPVFLGSSPIQLNHAIFSGLFEEYRLVRSFPGLVLLLEVFACVLVSDSRGNSNLTKLDELTISKIHSEKTIHSIPFRQKQRLGSKKQILEQAV